MTQMTKGNQYELECSGLKRHGLHDDERCFAERRRVVVDLPRLSGTNDTHVPVDVAGAWRHMQDDEHEWGALSALDRARYMTLCIPGLIGATRGVNDVGELISLEGMAEAYGSLPFEGPLTRQPAAMLEGFAIIRQTRNMEKMREIRERQVEQDQRMGAQHGE